MELPSIVEAHDLGVHAGRSGQSMATCPFSATSTLLSVLRRRSAWVGGFRIGVKLATRKRVTKRVEEEPLSCKEGTDPAVALELKAEKAKRKPRMPRLSVVESSELRVHLGEYARRRIRQIKSEEALR